jgi:hypothetical protein
LAQALQLYLIVICCLLVALRRRDHPRFSDLIDPRVPKIIRSLARNTPSQIL